MDLLSSSVSTKSEIQAALLGPPKGGATFGRTDWDRVKPALYSTLQRDQKQIKTKAET